MKRLIALALFVVSSAAVVSAQAGWVTIFDGKNLDAFDVVGTANWKIADGAVEANTGTGFLVTKAPYPDFELKADFWVTDDANSGIFIRLSDPKTITAANSYEVNIYDKRPDPAYRTGAIVDVAKPLAQLTTGGKWNTMEIMAKGPHMVVTINGTKTVDVEDKKFAGGPLALQYGAGTVKFRNVQIRKL